MQSLPSDQLLAAGRSGFFASTDIEELGVSTFALISSWHEWVHRRVETVRFHELDTVRRGVSVDFTWPSLTTPLVGGDGTPRHLVPVAILRKRRLTNFDLRDESGRVLPLLSRRANSLVSASTLAAAAQAFSDRGEPLPEIPRAVADDLWDLVTQPGGPALGQWRDLGRCTDNRDEDERAWRDAMMASARYRELAHDLARNFIVFTPLAVSTGDRRIVKFGYDERTLPPRLRPLRRRRLPTRRKAPPAVEVKRQCRVHVKAIVNDERSGETPLAGVRVELQGDRSYDLRTDVDGLGVVQVDAGKYSMRDVPPPNYIATTSVEDEVDVSEPETPLTFTYRRDSVVLGGGEAVPELSWRKKFLRLTWIQDKDIQIIAPAVGQSRSYHFELEVPEGIFVTRAHLVTLPTYKSSTAHTATETVDTHHSSGHRVHLYHAGDEQAVTATAQLWLRPRPSTVLRGSVAVSVLSLLVLAALAIRWEEINVHGLGPAIGLMLAIPGGLSAYVARAQTTQFTSEILLGLRLLALTGAFWGVCAGVILLVSRSVTIENGTMHVGDALMWTAPALYALVAANATVALILGLALRRSRACWRASQHESDAGVSFVDPLQAPLKRVVQPADAR